MPKPTAKRFALIRDRIVLSYVNASSPKAAEREREKRFPGQADVVVKPAWMGARDHYTHLLAGFFVVRREIGTIIGADTTREFVQLAEEVVTLDGSRRTRLAADTKVSVDLITTSTLATRWVARRLRKSDCQQCGAPLDGTKLGCGDCQMGYTN